MLISDEKRFIFVHLPKSGGSSVSAALGAWSLPRNRALWASWLRWIGLPRDYRRFRFGKHAGLPSAERIMPGARYREYFKFGFVRNPWERLVSDYNSVVNDPSHRRHRRVAALGSFEAYLKCEAPRVMGCQLEAVSDRSGKIGLDFVGRFEHLHRDFGEVCRHVGVEVELPHVNGFQHARYQDYYGDEAREFVARTWARDVEAFAYDFEQGSGWPEIPPTARVTRAPLEDSPSEPGEGR